MSLRRAAERCLRNQIANIKGNAFINRPKDEDGLLQLASEADARHQSGKPKSVLDGQLIAIKDNICTKDLPTTCASAVLKNYASPFNATVVHRLQDAGALMAGKTNLDAFGMGSHSIYSAVGAVRNIKPQDQPERSAGGSSGGSALAVATGQCYAALGTDTGGSVRLPAAYTGTVGFKPSYGLVSRWGVVAYANSLDTVGVLASNTVSAKEVFDVINFYDPHDPTSLSKSTRARIAEHVSHRPKNNASRIGIPLEYNIQELDPIIRRTWQRSIEFFQQQGHSVIPVHLPTTKHALSAYYILAPSEASSNLAKYDGVRYGTRADGPDDAEGGVLYTRTRGENFGEEVKARILLGTFSLSAAAIDNYFIQAQKIRRMVQNEFNSVFALANPLLPNTSFTDTSSTGQQAGTKDEDKRVDVLLCPTAPTLPPPLESLYDKNCSPLDAYTNDVLTVPASLAGLPAVSVPVGLEDVDREGYPDVASAGVQIIGQFGDDARVLTVGRMLEEGLSPQLKQ